MHCTFFVESNSKVEKKEKLFIERQKMSMSSLIWLLFSLLIVYERIDIKWQNAFNWKFLHSIKAKNLCAQCLSVDLFGKTKWTCFQWLEKIALLFVFAFAIAFVDIVESRKIIQLNNKKRMHALKFQISLKRLKLRTIRHWTISIECFHYIKKRAEKNDGRKKNCWRKFQRGISRPFCDTFSFSFSHFFFSAFTIFAETKIASNCLILFSVRETFRNRFLFVSRQRFNCMMSSLEPKQWIESMFFFFVGNKNKHFDFHVHRVVFLWPLPFLFITFAMRQCVFCVCANEQQQKGRAIEVENKRWNMNRITKKKLKK